MENWQTIDTAPVDTPVLVYETGDMTTATGRAHQSRMGVVTVSWQLVLTGAYAEDIDFYPSHWMPLPEPPKV